MREWINLFESVVPDWFLAGTPIDITDARWDEVAEFLEGAEFSYEWRLCRVPVRLAIDPNFEAMQTHDQSPSARMTAIRDWAKTRGGLDQALEERPPIFLWTSQGRLVPIDGYHRTGVASEDGLEIMPMFVGLGDPA